MTCAPVLLTYGVETKSHWAIVNGLRRLAGVSLFIPLILVVIKAASGAYVRSMSDASAASPAYQQYAAAIDLMVNGFALKGYALIDLFIAGVTLAVFGVVIAAKFQSNDRGRDHKRPIVLAGLGMILTIYNLQLPWHGSAYVAPVRPALISQNSPR